MIKKIKNKAPLKKDKNIYKWKAYNKKVRIYLIRISLYITILIILAAFLIGLFMYGKYLKNLDKETEESMLKQNKDSQQKLKETKADLKLLEKYIIDWKDIKENQMIPSGINLKVIRGLLEQLKNKYSILNYNFKMDIPTKVENINNRSNKELSIFTSNCQLSFSIAHDIMARRFISDLEHAIFGYIIIKDLSINKKKDYEFDDLLSLSRKESSGLVEVNINFDWYAAKKKNKANKIIPAPEEKNKD